MSGGEDYLRLGDMLLHRGVIDAPKLERSLKLAQITKQRIGDVLVDLGFVTEDDIARCLSEQYGFEIEDLENLKPDPKAVEKLTAEFALKWCVLPVEDAARFRCVVADPVNVDLTDTITAIARKPIHLTLAPKSALLTAIRVAYNLPLPGRVSKRKGRRAPSPESVLQRDRTLLLEAVSFEVLSGHSTRRAA